MNTEHLVVLVTARIKKVREQIAQTLVHERNNQIAAQLIRPRLFLPVQRPIQSLTYFPPQSSE